MGVVEIKAAVRARDGMCCTKCGMTNEEHRATYRGKSLDVHRVVPGSVYTVDGCVTLCKVCHSYEPRCPRRPRPSLNLTEKVQLALSPEMLARLKHQSRRLGISIGEYLRQAMMRSLRSDESVDPTLPG